MCFFWQWDVITMKNALLWSKQTHFSSIKRVNGKPCLNNLASVRKDVYTMPNNFLIKKAPSLVVFTAEIKKSTQSENSSLYFCYSDNFILLTPLEFWTLGAHHWYASNWWIQFKDRERGREWPNDAELPHSCFSSLFPPPSFTLVHLMQTLGLHYEVCFIFT